MAEVLLLVVSRQIMGTQRQFLENICSEDDLRSRIFGIIVVKFLCLPASPRIFDPPPQKKKWYNCPFLTDFLRVDGL